METVRPRLWLAGFPLIGLQRGRLSMDTVSRPVLAVRVAVVLLQRGRLSMETVSAATQLATDMLARGMLQRGRLSMETVSIRGKAIDYRPDLSLQRGRLSMETVSGPGTSRRVASWWCFNEAVSRWGR